METKSRILCFCLPSGRDVIAYAVTEAEPGDVVESHYSSNVDFAKYDIGIHSERKHDTYRREFPNGYELVWIDDPLNHPVLGPRIERADSNEEQRVNE